MDILEELYGILPDSNSYDAYGSCMEWLFTICHVIHHKYGKMHIPMVWEYTPSPFDTFMNFEEYYLISLHDLHMLTRIDLLIIGGHLFSLRNKLVSAGRDY